MEKEFNKNAAETHGFRARTDLALENFRWAEAQGKGVPGIIHRERQGPGCSITEIVVENDLAGEPLGKPAGRYVTVEMPAISRAPADFPALVEALAGELTQFLDCPLEGGLEGPILVFGLGNLDITPDALGPLVCQKILVTRHLRRALEEEGAKDPFLSSLTPVSALAPGVLGQTGIEAAEVAAMICKEIQPAAVIVVDALACADISRLGTTIQLADSGVSPGSGVQNRRKELSRRSLGVPVVAMGVPTVVDMHTIAHGLTNRAPDQNMPNFMVTPRDVDQLVRRGAKLIAAAINSALQPMLQPEDIEVLAE